ncbi:hypothetical protein Sjap_016701 [Stephania japonica]|uniref:Avr9/Cf-9 rapidly elicited protein n=1 Tax=Stephania japonica TaxID=461633 RepID=A0AAP0ILG5_9MAGN
MEVHSRVNSVVAKKLWNFLRIAYFMMRKGLISKRKLIMDMNLMMKRGKLLRKTVTNLFFHHHHHSRNATHGGGLQEYEFSCSNSPNPVFFHMLSTFSNSNKRCKHHHLYSYFPCINPPLTHHDFDESEIQHHKSSAVVNVNLLPKIEYSPEYQFNFRFAMPKVGGETLVASPLLSPFSVRISNYSSEDDENNEIVGNSQVDDDAEEFIRRFYEQLKMQSRTQLLEY